MRSVHHGLAAETTQAELLELVAALGDDDDVDGILVQLPLPDQIDPDAVVAAIDPGKDVDGLTADQRRPARARVAGPCPLHPGRGDGAARHEGVELEGAEAVIVGRSNLVGRPLASLLLGATRP